MLRQALLICLLLSGCASKRDPGSGYTYFTHDDAPAAYETDGVVVERSELTKVPAGRSYQSAVGKAPPAPPPPPPAPAPMDPGPPLFDEPALAELAEEEAAPAAERMVHYDGHARVRVTDPAETLDQVADLALEAGGRVERLAGRHITVRVPVGSFEAVWAKVLGLGEVIGRSVRADDVTDQFLAVDLRVRMLRTTRDRLIALLAKATDEKEKLALLREITRVTEELDAFEARLRTLADLASMSRISVEAIPREAFSGRSSGPELFGHAWIRQLSPFNRSVPDDYRLALPVPEGFVSLAKEGPFRAESADGAVLWTFRLSNDPVGTASWWKQAIVERIGEEFGAVQHKELGSWACAAFDEPVNEEPYRWQVCVQGHGKKLVVAQAFFPGPAQVDRYEAAVDGTLRRTGGGS